MRGMDLYERREMNEVSAGCVVLEREAEAHFDSRVATLTVVGGGRLLLLLLLTLRFGLINSPGVRRSVLNMTGRIDAR